MLSGTLKNVLRHSKPKPNDISQFTCLKRVTLRLFSDLISLSQITAVIPIKQEVLPYKLFASQNFQMAQVKMSSFLIFNQLGILCVQRATQS